MALHLIKTNDGSHSLYSDVIGATYHSKFGAVQESLHVFIEAGLKKAASNFNTSLNILEIGFGTGLNAILTLIACDEIKLNVNYTAIEKNPLSMQIVNLLNYPHLVSPQHGKNFYEIHNCPWNSIQQLTTRFALFKIGSAFEDFNSKNQFELIYHDAFAPVSCPELWTCQFFEKLFCYQKSGGIMVTFCAKSEVKRNLKSVGYKIETLKGPPGKREMLRAIKI